MTTSAPATIRTFTGRDVSPLMLRTDDVDVRDIAHALSMICRFTGHVSEFYSVAQHSVLLSYRCGFDVALWGLLHDASEAYLVDVPRPLKRAPEMGFYRAVERDAMAVICCAFNLSLIEPESVRVADGRMLVTECRDLMGGMVPVGFEGVPAYERRIRGWPPAMAEAMFLRRFRALRNGTAVYEEYP